MRGVGLPGFGVDIDLSVKVGYDERCVKGIDVGDEWVVEGDDEGGREEEEEKEEEAEGGSSVRLFMTDGRL